MEQFLLQNATFITGVVLALFCKYLLFSKPSYEYEKPKEPKEPKVKTILLESGLGSGLEEKVESVINEVGYDKIKKIEYATARYWYGSEKTALIIYDNPNYKE